MRVQLHKRLLNNHIRKIFHKKNLITFPFVCLENYTLYLWKKTNEMHMYNYSKFVYSEALLALPSLTVFKQEAPSPENQQNSK